MPDVAFFPSLERPGVIVSLTADVVTSNCPSLRVLVMTAYEVEMTGVADEVFVSASALLEVDFSSWLDVGVDLDKLESEAIEVGEVVGVTEAETEEELDEVEEATEEELAGELDELEVDPESLLVGLLVVEVVLPGVEPLPAAVEEEAESPPAELALIPEAREREGSKPRALMRSESPQAASVI